MRLDVCSSAAVGSNDMVDKEKYKESVDARSVPGYERD
jgi:hypothetical protein